jgi:hypothetical protein
MIRSGRGRARRVAGAVGGVLVAIVAWAAPAAADPAKPTDYRSTVDRLDPDTNDVSVHVRGGDAFLEVTAAPGHEVVVLGYEDEPYLRFDKDGTVERNRLSPATTINQTRFGTEAPPDSDPEADPEWETVADGGSYAWHDHRIHWMSPIPPDTAEGGVIFDWKVPLQVDGDAVTVEGTLTRVPGISPLPWIALIVVVGAGVLLLAWRWRPQWTTHIAAVATLAGGIIATVLGVAEWTTSPAGAGASPLLVVLGPVTAVLGVASLLMLRRRKQEPASFLALGASAMLTAWALRQLPALWKPVLPTEVPANLDRAALSVVTALALSSAVILVGGRLKDARRTRPAKPATPAPSPKPTPRPEPSG